MRLVLVNRREYPGSSPFTEEDLDKLRSEDDTAHVEFAKDRAKEIATFIKAFIDQEAVPRATADGKSGGVALMGWSSGASQTIALLGDADSLPGGLRKSIEPYLRSYIIYGTYLTNNACAETTSNHASWTARCSSLDTRPPSHGQYEEPSPRFDVNSRRTCCTLLQIHRLILHA